MGNRIREALVPDETVAVTVLIVDDHPSFRASVRTLLEAEGYEIVGEAENGETAVEAARALQPDLVLLDVQLPGIDGITALKQLRAEPKTRSIPVIAITASAMTHNRQTMLAEGFNGYQTKPISLKDFLGEVERVLAAARS